MKLEYLIMGGMIFLILGVLAQIAVSPDAVTVPKPTKQDSNEFAETVSETKPKPVTSFVPAPGFEDVPEMIVKESEPMQESSLVLEEQVSIESTTDKPSSEISDIPLEEAQVTIPEGSGVPGCEETNECYLPYEVKVVVGGKITWINSDTAAHTVTSGNIMDGIDGVFDSSIFMAGDSFSHTFDEAGTYEYFCMVHPWMTGVVQVS